MIEHSQDKKTGSLFVVSAPSGAGKTSLVNALLDGDSRLDVAVSHTTRQRRPGESDGKNYHFVDRDSFEALIEAQGFLEWANVFDHLYGTSVQAANRVLDTGKHLILEIDWQGAQQIRRQFPATQSIFILPPSLAALQQRLDHRGQDDETTVRKRMQAAFEEISHWQEFDYLIVNDTFEDALADIRAVVAGEGEKLKRDVRSSELAELITNLLSQSSA